jgi:hypothetical protein
MARDSLEGYRGIRPEGLRKAIVDAEDQPATSKYQRLVLGVAAEKLMAGVANAEDIAAVMAQVVQQAEAHAKSSLQALLSMPDLSAPEAIAAHFEARVAAQTITYLNDMIRSGLSAGRELTQDEESA